jgi:hypothetical protein
MASVGTSPSGTKTPLGLPGATAATRYAGGTASGAPTTGTFAVGDIDIDQTGILWICTVAGTPGTWVDAGSAGNLVTSVFARTGAVVAASGDYTAAQVTNAADLSSAALQTFTGSIAVAAGKQFQGTASGAQTLYSCAIAGDTAPRLAIGSDGTLKFGPGNAGLDTTINRATATELDFSSILGTRGMKTVAITSGALSTISPSTGTALQVSTARDVFLVQACTFNPTAGASATCVVAISPDNSTFSTLVTVTIPAGITFDGTIPPISLQVPAAWWVKFTTTNATLGTGTWY